MGAKVKASNSEMSTAAAMVMPNCLKNLPAMPVAKPTGRKTETRVRVVARTARPTSAVPSLAACMGCLPSFSMWRKMFSRTTMASSMSRPMDRLRASRVMTLIVKPRAAMTA